ncbi:MAG: alanine/glycine:cation symporter family protein [Pseudomonadota bacterium]
MQDAQSNWFVGLVETTNALVWGSDTIQYPPVLILLLGTGLFLTIRLGFMPILKMPYGFAQLFKKRENAGEEGDVSPFGALMTALSSTIGTGNIAGVAVAIAIGGPGAIFWMWMTALLGMASKYAEGVLALRFRETDGEGRHVGGPMYYIKNGMGPKWVWLGATFAVFGVLASWGTGAYIQANSVSDAVRAAVADVAPGADGLNSIVPLIVGVMLAAGAAAVILGGIKRIANVASRLVPAMAFAYLAAGLLVIFLNIGSVPAALGSIFTNAFGIDAAKGGFIGGLLLLAMQKGVARGIFSNEAGQGSAPIAHAAAKNNDPVNQGLVAMLGTFIDTIVVCSITALVILSTNVVPEACAPFVRPDLLTLPTDAGCLTGAPLTAAAFDSALPGVGRWIVTIGLLLFAFTTILGWSYYGERCAEYLLGEKAVVPFRFSWIAVVFIGASILLLENNPSITGLVNLFWLVADTLTGLMAAPNLVALIALSPLIVRMTNEYFEREKAKAVR